MGTTVVVSSPDAAAYANDTVLVFGLSVSVITLSNPASPTNTMPGSAIARAVSHGNTIVSACKGRRARSPIFAGNSSAAAISASIPISPSAPAADADADAAAGDGFVDAGTCRIR